jgi:hypothetical protein
VEERRRVAHEDVEILMDGLIVVWGNSFKIFESYQGVHLITPKV